MHQMAKEKTVLHVHKITETMDEEFVLISKTLALQDTLIQELEKMIVLVVSEVTKTLMESALKSLFAN